MKTDKELRDMAYLTATGEFLTKCFTFKQYQRTNLDNWKWEPFEYWPTNELASQITGLAEKLFNQYKKIRDAEK